MLTQIYDIISHCYSHTELKLVDTLWYIILHNNVNLDTYAYEKTQDKISPIIKLFGNTTIDKAGLILGLGPANKMVF